MVKDEIKIIDVKLNELKSVLPDVNSSCSLLTDCTSCSAISTCGWCSITQSCQEGSSAGPKEGSCAFWEFNKCSGTTECKSHKSCDQCIKDVNCGWCSNIGEPVCMNKSDGEKNCHEDRFINLMMSMNICPHIVIVNTILYRIIMNRRL